MSVIKKNDIVRIKKGWFDEGREGICLGNPVFVRQSWTPVLWNGDEDPDFFKTAGIDSIRKATKKETIEATNET